MSYKRIVIKVGSHVLTQNGEISRKRMRDVVELISTLMLEGTEVILVSSGAVSAGYSQLPLDMFSTQNKQVLASIGQSYLLRMYQEDFEKYEMLCSQILINRAEFDSKSITNLAKQAVDNLLKNGVVPIINENDVTSIEELVFGDNDKLSAHVAHYFDAELLVLLSDIDAYYDKDPKKYKDALAYREVSTIPKEDLDVALVSNNAFATGGIVSKLKAIEFILENNKEAFLATGFNLLDIENFLLSGTHKGGTFFKKSV
ncbi:MAG: glutamate 5-kinase [Sulfurovaceae bacterium]|nr:glutamate 5-kinase [Sulfurovaceae bacterium]